MKRMALTMMIVFFLVTAGLLSLAQADPQSALVVDQAGVFMGSVAKVEKAAQELQSMGADVHVWTVASYAGDASSLDEYFEKLLAKFSAWRSSDGGKKNNLIVLIISLKERKTGLYYGGQWSGPLGRNWTRVQTDFMNPRFKRGEFADGFAAGLGEVKDLIYDHLHPKTAPVQVERAPVVVVQQSQPSEPIDLSGLWAVLRWSLVVGVVVAFFGFGFIFMRTRRKEQEERQEAQQRAKIQKTGISNKIGELRTRAKEIEQLIGALSGSIRPELVEKFQTILGNIQEQIVSITQNFSVTDSSVGNPDDNNRTQAQYRAIEKKFAEISDPTDKALKELSELRVALTKLRDDAVAIPGLLVRLAADAEEAEKVFAAIRDKGFEIDDAKVVLSEGKKLMDEAKKLFADKLIPEVAEKIREAEAKILEAQEQVLILPDIKSRIDADIKSLEELGPRVVEDIAKGREVFEGLRVNFVQGSLESISGNGTEAEKRVSVATAMLEKARAMASMEEQDWAGANELIKNANGLLAQAVSLMKSIFSLEKNLNKAKDNVHTEVDEVENNIRKAWGYIKQFGDDIQNSLKADLSQAEKTIAEVKAELSKGMPDYIVAFKMAQKANALTDKIYDQAVEEHEANERERKKARAQKQSAKAAFSRAREYFEDHKGDIDDDARRRLNAAEEALRNAETQANTTQLIALMALCQSESNQAYSLAKQDVSSAESSRSVSRGSSGGSTAWGNNSPSSDIGGGGSTSFDFGGGGGGSSSFGGCDTGGGGSTSW